MFSRYGKRQKTILALCHQTSVDTFVWRWEEVRTNIHSTFISILKKQPYIDKYWLQNIPLWAFLMLLSATQHETHRWPYLQSSSLCTIVTMIKFQWNLRFGILYSFYDFMLNCFTNWWSKLNSLKRLFLFWRDCFFLRQVERLAHLLKVSQSHNVFFKPTILPKNERLLSLLFLKIVWFVGSGPGGRISPNLKWRSWER